MLIDPSWTIFGTPLEFLNHTSNQRWKYWRKKCIFPTEKWISSGQYDGVRLVRIQLVAEIIPTESDGMRRKYPIGIPSDIFYYADWEHGQGGKFRRKFPSENLSEIPSLLKKKISFDFTPKKFFFKKIRFNTHVIVTKYENFECKRNTNY